MRLILQHVALRWSLFIMHPPSKGRGEFITNAALGSGFFGENSGSDLFSLYFALDRNSWIDIPLFKCRFENGSSSRTVACDHGFRGWQVDCGRSIHEAEVCPSVEHVEVDGHVQVQDLCDHSSYVCGRGKENIR